MIPNYLFNTSRRREELRKIQRSVPLEHQKDKNLVLAHEQVIHRYRLIYVDFRDPLQRVADAIKPFLESEWPGLLVVKRVLKPGVDTRILLRVREHPSYSTPAYVYWECLDKFDYSASLGSELDHHLSQLSEDVGIHGGFRERRR